MLSLETIPNVSAGTCGLTVQFLGEVNEIAAAWKLLPETGEGVVVCADSVRRYDPSQRTGLLLDAEVVNDSATTILRSLGASWKAWRWSETSGSSHRYVEHIFLSSEPGRKALNQIYRQYWARQEESGIQVWRPLGARFCGFASE